MPTLEDFAQFLFLIEIRMQQKSVRQIAVGSHLLLELGAVNVETFADGADVVEPECREIVKKLWSHKVDHAPVLFEAVLKRVACQNDASSALNLLCRDRKLCLSSI
jgi:hypothetical protein